MQRMDNTNHWINLYPVDSTVGFVNAYPLYSDSSIQYHNLPLKQPGKAWATTIEDWAWT